MKKRNLFIATFLVLALLFLGVGYASLSNNLAINGSLSATKNNDNLKVEFVGVTQSTKEPDGSESTAFTLTTTSVGQTATLAVNNISVVGQTAIATFVVQNNSIDLQSDSLTAILDSVFEIKLGTGTVSGSTYTMTSEPNDTDGNTKDNLFSGEHFTVKVEYSVPTLEEGNEEAANWGTIDEKGAVTLASGQKVNVVVTIVLKEIVSVDDFPLHVLTIAFKASTATQQQ